MIKNSKEWLRRKKWSKTKKKEWKFHSLSKEREGCQLKPGECHLKREISNVETLLGQISTYPTQKLIQILPPPFPFPFLEFPCVSLPFLAFPFLSGKHTGYPPPRKALSPPPGNLPGKANYPCGYSGCRIFLAQALGSRFLLAPPTSIFAKIRQNGRRWVGAKRT